MQGHKSWANCFTANHVGRCLEKNGRGSVYLITITHLPNNTTKNLFLHLYVRPKIE